MEFASGNGNGCRTTEFTIAKSAVFAAMQTASVSRTVSANPLALHIERAAYFISRRNKSMICLPRHKAPHQRKPKHTTTCHSIRIDEAKCSNVTKGPALHSFMEGGSWVLRSGSS